MPPLSEARREVLALFKAIPGEPGIAMEFRLEPGDTLLASNHTVMHRRSAFTDATDSAPSRQMLRLWLTIPDARPLPAHYADTREFRYTWQRCVSFR